MIRLSKLTDYAFVILFAFLKESENVISVSHISDRTSLPEPTVSKILKTLCRNNILESQRGVNGGYSLLKPAEDIVVGEVVEMFEGPIALTTCVDTNSENCALEGICELNGKWSGLNNEIRQLFYARTLTDMMSQTQNPLGTHSYKAVNHQDKRC